MITSRTLLVWWYSCDFHRYWVSNATIQILPSFQCCRLNPRKQKANIRVSKVAQDWPKWTSECPQTIGNITIFLCYPSWRRRWRYHEYLQILAKYKDILMISIVSEALEVPRIPPDHCKYHDILMFSIPWIPSEHYKYNTFLCFFAYERRWRHHEYLQNIVNILIFWCFPLYLRRWRNHEYVQNLINITIIVCFPSYWMRWR